MLVEVKTKVVQHIAGKEKRFSRTYIIPNCEVFTEAEYKVTELLNKEVNSHLIKEFEIQGLKISNIKEICTEWYDETSDIPAYIAVVKGLDVSQENMSRYSILLWAKNHTQAIERTNDLLKQGYDMKIESIKEVNYIYLPK